MDRTLVLVEMRPPGGRTVDALKLAVRRLVHVYAVTVGVDRGIDPRRQSVVEHRVEGAAPDVARRLAEATGAPPMYDEVDHEFRFPTRMHVAWAWPDLPMWLAVAELSPTRCALRLSLRSRKRLRYPSRYFHVAHRTLADVERRVRSAA